MDMGVGCCAAHHLDSAVHLAPEDRASHLWMSVVYMPTKRHPCSVCAAPIGSKSEMCRPCRDADRRAKAKQHTCPTCKGQFWYDSRETKLRFCTPECRQDYPRVQKLDGRCSPVPWGNCSECSAPTIKRVTCSPECSRSRMLGQNRDRYRATYIHKVQTLTCPTCEQDFTVEGKQGVRVFCSRECHRASPGYKAARQVARRRRRALKQGAICTTYKDADIFRRDRYRCGLCGEMTLRHRPTPDDWAPTIDHITPFAKGGHDTPGNVQCAHFICNSYKGDRIDLTIHEMRAWVIPRLLRDQSKWDVAYAGIDDWNAA